MKSNREEIATATITRNPSLNKLQADEAASFDLQNKKDEHKLLSEGSLCLMSPTGQQRGFQALSSQSRAEKATDDDYNYGDKNYVVGMSALEFADYHRVRGIREYTHGGIGSSQIKPAREDPQFRLERRRPTTGTQVSFNCNRKNTRVQSAKSESIFSARPHSTATAQQQKADAQNKMLKTTMEHLGTIQGIEKPYQKRSYALTSAQKRPLLTTGSEQARVRAINRQHLLSQVNRGSRPCSSGLKKSYTQESQKHQMLPSMSQCLGKYILPRNSQKIKGICETASKNHQRPAEDVQKIMHQNNQRIRSCAAVLSANSASRHSGLQRASCHDGNSVQPPQAAYSSALLKVKNLELDYEAQQNPIDLAMQMASQHFGSQQKSCSPPANSNQHAVRIVNEMHSFMHRTEQSPVDTSLQTCTPPPQMDAMTMSFMQQQQLSNTENAYLPVPQVSHVQIVQSSVSGERPNNHSEEHQFVSASFRPVEHEAPGTQDAAEMPNVLFSQQKKVNLNVIQFPSPDKPLPTSEVYSDARPYYAQFPASPHTLGVTGASKGVARRQHLRLAKRIPLTQKLRMAAEQIKSECGDYRPPEGNFQDSDIMEERYSHTQHQHQRNGAPAIVFASSTAEAIFEQQSEAPYMISTLKKTSFVHNNSPEKSTPQQAPHGDYPKFNCQKQKNASQRFLRSDGRVVSANGPRMPLAAPSIHLNCNNLQQQQITPQNLNSSAELRAGIRLVDATADQEPEHFDSAFFLTTQQNRSGLVQTDPTAVGNRRDAQQYVGSAAGGQYNNLQSHDVQESITLPLNSKSKHKDGGSNSSLAVTKTIVHPENTLDGGSRAESTLTHPLCVVTFHSNQQPFLLGPHGATYEQLAQTQLVGSASELHPRARHDSQIRIEMCGHDAGETNKELERTQNQFCDAAGAITCPNLQQLSPQLLQQHQNFQVKESFQTCNNDRSNTLTELEEMHAAIMPLDIVHNVFCGTKLPKKFVNYRHPQLQRIRSTDRAPLQGKRMRLMSAQAAQRRHQSAMKRPKSLPRHAEHRSDAQPDAAERSAISIRGAVEAVSSFRDNNVRTELRGQELLILKDLPVYESAMRDLSPVTDKGSLRSAPSHLHESTAVQQKIAAFAGKQSQVTKSKQQKGAYGLAARAGEKFICEDLRDVGLVFKSISQRDLTPEVVRNFATKQHAPQQTESPRAGRGSPEKQRQRQLQQTLLNSNFIEAGAAVQLTDKERKGAAKNMSRSAAELELLLQLQEDMLKRRRPRFSALQTQGRKTSFAAGSKVQSAARFSNLESSGEMLQLAHATGHHNHLTRSQVLCMEAKELLLNERLLRLDKQEVNKKLQEIIHGTQARPTANRSAHQHSMSGANALSLNLLQNSYPQLVLQVPTTRDDIPKLATLDSEPQQAASSSLQRLARGAMSSQNQTELLSSKRSNPRYSHSSLNNQLQPENPVQHMMKPLVNVKEFKVVPRPKRKFIHKTDKTAQPVRREPTLQAVGQSCPAQPEWIRKSEGRIKYAYQTSDLQAQQRNRFTLSSEDLHGQSGGPTRATHKKVTSNGDIAHDLTNFNIDLISRPKIKNRKAK